MVTYPQRLAQIYRFSQQQEVESFLQKNDDLSPILIEAYEQIQGHFGAGTPATLEVFRDPEAEHEPELFLVIQTSLPGDQARTKRAQLYEEWWLRNSRRAGGRLHIDVE